MSRSIQNDYNTPREYERRTAQHLWVCHECATLVPMPPGHTGIALCDVHTPAAAVVELRFCDEVNSEFRKESA